MKYELKNYKFSTNGKSDVVTWGNDAFWAGWTELKTAGYLTATTTGPYGHVTIEITAQTKSLQPRTAGFRS